MNKNFMNKDNHTKNIQCECGGLTFAATYNHKEAEISLYCTECNSLAHTRRVFWNPLENIQGDIIDLLKLIYKGNTVQMKGFVGTYLKAKKVQECNNMDYLNSAFETLYAEFEKNENID